MKTRFLVKGLKWQCPMKWKRRGAATILKRLNYRLLGQGLLCIRVDLTFSLTSNCLKQHKGEENSKRMKRKNNLYIGHLLVWLGLVKQRLWMSKPPIRTNFCILSFHSDLFFFIEKGLRPPFFVGRFIIFHRTRYGPSFHK